MVKMMIIGRRRSGITRTDMQQHMLDVHGRMVVNFIQQEPEKAPKRYVQNHVLDCSHSAGSPSEKPWALDRDFVTQVWFDSLPAAMASLEEVFYKEQLRPDEDNFVDQSTVVKFPVRETVLVKTGDDAASFKLFAILKRAPSVTEEEFNSSLQRLTDSIISGPGGQFISQHTRNHVMARPGDDTVATLVEEYWTDSLEAATQLAQRLRKMLVDGAVTEDRVIAPDTFAILIAKEHALYAGNV